MPGSSPSPRSYISRSNSSSNDVGGNIAASGNDIGYVSRNVHESAGATKSVDVKRLYSSSGRQPNYSSIVKSYSSNTLPRLSDRDKEFLFGSRSEKYSLLRRVFLLLTVISVMVAVMYGLELYLRRNGIEEGRYDSIMESTTAKRASSSSVGDKMAHFGRVYLLGDSMIKTFLPAHFFGETYDWVDYSPLYTSKKDWYYLMKFRYKHSDAAVIKSSDTGAFRTGYLLGNFINADVIATEMFKNFKPNYNDILVILYGAHSYLEQYNVYKDFMQNVYNKVAVRFPGQTFWYEPFPQHFSGGIFNHTVKDLKCYPLSKEGNASQYWRVTVYKEVVKETDKIHQVDGYNVMAGRWMYHLGNKTKHHYYKPADCTHYSVEGSGPVVENLKKMVLKYSADKQKIAREAIHGKNYTDVLKKRHSQSAMLPISGG